MPLDYRRVLSEQNPAAAPRPTRSRSRSGGKSATRAICDRTAMPSPSPSGRCSLEVAPWVSRPDFWSIAASCRTGGRFADRVSDYLEVYEPFPLEKLQAQGARCMDCGIPFCHQGCPLGNLIPDWNDLVYRGQWKAAIERLHATNNFPEFTGKLCPAPCEASCVLGINNDPVTIKQIEASIVEMAWNEGWIKPEPPRRLTGKKVAIVGSGPAGLACAQQLARAGHAVTVYERADRIGGLLRYGIPDFKMEKRHLDRRLEQMEAEGVDFVASTNVGVDIPARKLLDEFDAVCLCGGSTRPRDLPIEGRNFSGIDFAMDFLTRQNRRGAGDAIDESEFISAHGKDVIIIGGGDTGADCLGTVHRQGCKSVHQFEIVPRPPDERPLQSLAAVVEHLPRLLGA